MIKSYYTTNKNVLFMVEYCFTDSIRQKEETYQQGSFINE